VAVPAGERAALEVVQAVLELAVVVLDPVPPGNSIVSLTCLFACGAGAVMVG
jgi:hypothetical protein